MYVQMAFVLDRVKALASQHPQWKEQEPFASVLKDDLKALAALGEKGLVEIVGVTRAARGWTVVNMKNDWKTVFPPQ